MMKIKPHPPQTLEWWHTQYLLNRVEMNPPYQRRAMIWSKWKRAHLIDSIINDFDVPKFYVANFNELQVNELNSTKRVFAIIDGKQRFGAIFDFLDDKFPLNKSATWDERPEVRLGGLTYREIKDRFPTLAAKVEDFVPSVMSVLTDEPHKIEELFVRLNMGEATTGAERRNAMGGPVPEVMRELAMHPFFQRKIRFATKRMEEHNLIAKLLLIEFKGHFVDTKKTDLDKFVSDAVDWLSTATEVDLVNDPYAKARDRVFSHLEILSNEFETSDKLLSSAGAIPIYYWFVRENPRLANELRDFVLDFTNDVRASLQAQRDDPKSANPRMVSYYTMSRTTNDQASLDGRYKIFMATFADWRKPKPLRRLQK